MPLTNTDMRFSIVKDSLIEVTSQGYWLVEVRAARTGLQSYLDMRFPEGKRIELRHIEDITDELSLASWAHAPASIRHSAWFDLKTPRGKKHGYAFDVARIEQIDGEDWIVVKVCLDTEEIVEGVRTGALVEVSPGYDRDFDGIGGVMDGVNYHGRQRNIRINHLAFLPPGMARGGRYARVLLDSGEESFEFNTINNKGGRETMPDQTTLQRVVLDSKTSLSVNLNPDNAIQVQRVLDQKDYEIKTLDSFLTAEKEKTANLNGQVETLQSEKEELETQLKDAQDSRPDFKSLLAVYAKAKPFLPEDFDIQTMDSLTEHDLKLQAVKGRFPKKTLDSYEPGKISGMFEAMADTPADKAPLGEGDPTPGAQKVFDAMDNTPAHIEDEDDTQDQTGRAGFLNSLASTTKKVLGGE